MKTSIKITLLIISCLLSSSFNKMLTIFHNKNTNDSNAISSLYININNKFNTNLEVRKDFPENKQETLFIPSDDNKKLGQPKFLFIILCHKEHKVLEVENEFKENSKINKLIISIKLLEKLFGLKNIFNNDKKMIFFENINRLDIKILSHYDLKKLTNENPNDQCHNGFVKEKLHGYVNKTSK